MTTLIQKQEEFIARVNACTRPLDRTNRVRKAASRKLRTYCIEKVGMSVDAARQCAIDAWDMAELERLCTD